MNAIPVSVRDAAATAVDAVTLPAPTAAGATAADGGTICKGLILGGLYEACWIWNLGGGWGIGKEAFWWDGKETWTRLHVLF